MADIKDTANEAVEKLAESMDKLVHAAEKLTASAESITGALPMRKKKERGWTKPLFGTLALAAAAAFWMFGRDMVKDLFGQVMGGGSKTTDSYSGNMGSTSSASDPFPMERSTTYPR